MRAIMPTMNLSSLDELNIHEAVAEHGQSFVENAILKARHACRHTDLPAIADDSGLEVDALQGQPGIHSARYAGEDADDNKNNQKLLRQLAAVPPPHRARFQCVIVYMRHAKDTTPVICHGTWHGQIIQTPRGTRGFGYDPVFYIPRLNKTAAELTAEEKNKLSHRARALQQLRQTLQ